MKLLVAISQKTFEEYYSSRKNSINLRGRDFLSPFHSEDQAKELIEWIKENHPYNYLEGFYLLSCLVSTGNLLGFLNRHQGEGEIIEIVKITVENSIHEERVKL